MQRQILAPIVNPACIQDVIRISLVDEVLVGSSLRHRMHLLIRDYIKSVYPMSSNLQKLHLFNASFIEEYSQYLIGVIKQCYSDETITDEQEHTFSDLEAQNLEQFENTVLFTKVDTKLGVKSSIALGLLIQENITGTYSVQQGVVTKVYSFYQDTSVFADLCATSSSKVCARIFWRILTNISIPECTSNNVIVLVYRIPLIPYDDSIIPSLSWFYNHSCLSVLSCNSLDPFWYGETSQLIENYMITDEENLLYGIVSRRAIWCNKFIIYLMPFYTSVALPVCFLISLWDSRLFRTIVLYTVMIHASFYCIYRGDILNEVASCALKLLYYYWSHTELSASLFQHSSSNMTCTSQVQDIEIVIDLSNCSCEDYQLNWNSPVLFFFLLFSFFAAALFIETKRTRLRTYGVDLILTYNIVALLIQICWLLHTFLSSSACEYPLTSLIISVLHRSFVQFVPIYMSSSTRSETPNEDSFVKFSWIRSGSCRRVLKCISFLIVGIPSLLAIGIVASFIFSNISVKLILWLYNFYYNEVLSSQIKAPKSL